MSTDDKPLRELEEDRIYLEKVRNLLLRSSSQGTHGPACLLDHLYIGNMQDAHNMSLLKRLRITHVLNCAMKTDYSSESFGKESPYDPASGIEYLGFEAHDNEVYPIFTHYPAARNFIDQAKLSGGKVLVHCELGINRSGALCTAYLMVEEKLTLLPALRQIKLQRRAFLCNEGFQKQLIQFARQRQLLYRQ